MDPRKYDFIPGTTFSDAVELKVLRGRDYIPGETMMVNAEIPLPAPSKPSEVVIVPTPVTTGTLSKLASFFNK